MLKDAILKLGPLPRLLNDISVALRNPQLHMPTNHQPDRPKDRLFSRPSFNRLMSSDFQSLMMRDLNRYSPVVSFLVYTIWGFITSTVWISMSSKGPRLQMILHLNSGLIAAGTLSRQCECHGYKWAPTAHKQDNYCVWV